MVWYLLQVGEALHKLKMKISDLGCRLILKMVFFDNFIHGDLHPGTPEALAPLPVVLCAMLLI
jgi:hypothetical protein